MVAAGVMEGVDFVYGCHLWTPLEYGKVAAVPGAVHGRRGLLHAHDHRPRRARGLPHTAVDTVAGAAELVGSLQHIVSRRIDPLQPAVVTIGSLHAGDAPNVIPGEAVLTGTTRSFDPDVRERIPKLIEEIAAGVCAAHGADLRAGLPVRLQARRQRGARDASSCARRSADELVELDPIMGGDDFSAFLAEAPGCYAFIGAGGEYPHHHPRFRIDERALATARGSSPGREPSARGVRMTRVRGGVGEDVLADLRRRLDATRWPDEAPDAGPEHGFGLAAARELAAYWRDGYDWRAAEAVLNGFEQRVSTACTSSPRATARRWCSCTAGRAASGSSRGSCRCCASTRG